MTESQAQTFVHMHAQQQAAQMMIDTLLMVPDELRDHAWSIKLADSIYLKCRAIAELVTLAAFLKTLEV